MISKILSLKFLITVGVLFGIPTVLLFGVMPTPSARLAQERTRLRAAGKPASKSDLGARYGLVDMPNADDLKWREVADLLGKDPDVSFLTDRLLKNRLNDFADMRPNPGERWKDGSNVNRWLANRQKGLDRAIELLDSSVPLRFPAPGSKSDDESFNSFSYVVSKGLRLKLWQAIDEDQSANAWKELTRMWSLANAMSASPNVNRHAEISFEATLATIHALRCIQLDEANLAKLQQIVTKQRLYARVGELNDTFRAVALDGHETALATKTMPFLLKHSAIGTKFFNFTLEDLQFNEQILTLPPTEALLAIAERETSPRTDWFSRLINSIDSGKSQKKYKSVVPVSAIAAITRVESYCRCLEATIAVERFRLKNKSIPKNLSDLSPTLLAAAPIDVYSAKPVLLRTMHDRYWIDSVGPNGKHEAENKGDDIRVTLETKRTDVAAEFKSVPSGGN